MAKRPSNRLVRKAIREIMVPAILQHGFEGRYPAFKRVTQTEIHFLTFDTAKYGGSFSYSVGWCANRPLNHWDERIIPTDEIEMAHLPFEQRALAHRMTDRWNLDGTHFRASLGAFEYDLIVEDEEACRALVNEALETIPQAMAWLDTREEQEAVTPVGSQPISAHPYELTIAIGNNKERQRLQALGLID